MPSYGDAEVRYTVKTCTYFPGDTFFLGSSANEHLYADDFIDDVYVDVGLVWQDWMRDMGAYGAIYAWGDGLCYPLGEIQKPDLTVTFTFGEIWSEGLLDFQYVSFTYQASRIGNPRFRAENSITKEDGAPYGLYSFYGASKWSGNPGLSNREIAVAHDINVIGPGFYGEFSLQVGLGWAPLTSSEYIDFGIMLKLNWIYQEMMWSVILKNVKADIYTPRHALTLIPGSVLEFADPTKPEVQSVISPEFKVLVEVLCAIPAIVGSVKAGPIGAIAGTVVGGATEQIIYHYLEDQEVKPVQEEAGNSTYARISYGDDPVAIVPCRTSDNHLIFVQLRRNDALRCGTLKVVLSGITEATGIYVDPMGGGWPITYKYNFVTTIYIPWFLTD